MSFISTTNTNKITNNILVGSRKLRHIGSIWQQFSIRWPR